MKDILHHALRAVFSRKDGASLILRGRNAGLKMKGVGLPHVFGMVEPQLVSAVDKHVYGGANVLDIGSNIGYFTLMLARVVGPEGKVYAFEPIPQTFEVLKWNVERNRIENVTLFNSAVSARPGSITFRVPDAGRGLSMASAYWHMDDENAQTLEVESVVPDETMDIVREKVSFIKIDVEGAEGDVIKGIENIVTTWRPIVYTECSEIGRKPFWQFMQGLNYSVFDAINPAVRIEDFELYRHGDFLWMPAESFRLQEVHQRCCW